jgi:type VII secretion protein EccB
MIGVGSMASRREELSAYTFSRRRTVAAFLRPSGGGACEDAPRGLRAILPGIVVGALAVAGFGGYGLVRPSAPLHWRTADAVIVGRQSTTRYVWWNGALHPVLNIASARLLLGAGSSVVPVEDSVLDSVPHGATVGIPYAPDSLPTAADAGIPKVWAYCDRPANRPGGGTDEKLFVLDGADAAAASGAGRLGPRQALYVQGPDGATYLVDVTGTAHRLVGGDATGGAAATQRLLLATAAFGATVGTPQSVSSSWLATLRSGDPIGIPQGDIAGYGGPADVTVGQSAARIGDIFQVKDNGGGLLDYVVLQDGVHPLSPFAFQLLEAVHRGAPVPVVPDTAVLGANLAPPFEGGRDWPTSAVTQANSSSLAGSGDTVACSVYTGTASGAGVPGLGLWAGQSYPVDGTPGTAGVYVTPGSGLLYREVTGTSTDTGAVNLLTDTGLRCPVPMNGDAQARLGYSAVTRLPVVPLAWSRLLSAGPVLNSLAAGQQQGS